MWAPSNELGALIPLSDSLALAGYQRHFMRGEYMIPRHSSPSQFHPTVYAQNASLEISWTCNVTGKGSISGDIIKPFFTQGYEGFDVNTEDDLILAEALIARGLAQLPEVK